MRTKDAISDFLVAKSGLSPVTLRDYSKILDFLKRECAQMPSKPDVLRVALNKVNSAWVRYAYWRVWRAFFRWCSLEYGVRYPMELVEKPKVPKVEMRILDIEELGRVLSAANSVRDRAIIALAIDSGVRGGEFGHLRVGDVGKDTILLWGKGNKQALVPISPETHQLLELLVSTNGHRGFLFWGHKGPLTRYGVYGVVRGCIERAGISGCKRGPHCLRHSLGTNYIASGGDAFSLMRVMRHSNITTTQVYVHLAMKVVVDQHHKFSPLGAVLRGLESYNHSRISEFSL